MMNAIYGMVFLVMFPFMTLSFQISHHFRRITYIVLAQT